jgi:hypothetical protein
VGQKLKFVVRNLWVYGRRSQRGGGVGAMKRRGRILISRRNHEEVERKLFHLQKEERGRLVGVYSQRFAF